MAVLAHQWRNIIDDSPGLFQDFANVPHYHHFRWRRLCGDTCGGDRFRRTACVELDMPGRAFAAVFLLKGAASAYAFLGHAPRKSTDIASHIAFALCLWLFLVRVLLNWLPFHYARRISQSNRHKYQIMLHLPVPMRYCISCVIVIIKRYRF